MSQCILYDVAHPYPHARGTCDHKPLWAGNTVHPALCAQAFTDHYYNTFDTNRQALASLYQEQSLLTFEARHCTVSNRHLLRVLVCTDAASANGSKPTLALLRHECADAHPYIALLHSAQLLAGTEDPGASPDHPETHLVAFPAVSAPHQLPRRTAVNVAGHLDICDRPDFGTLFHIVKTTAVWCCIQLLKAMSIAAADRRRDEAFELQPGDLSCADNIVPHM